MSEKRSSLALAVELIFETLEKNSKAPPYV